ncbi:MAG: MBL fold metallo-hydrolase [Bacilli bacterium]
MVKIFQFDENQKEFSSNTYVVGKIGGTCLIIDLGATDKRVLDYIDSHYESIGGILLTHAHFDHIRGIPGLLRHYKNRNIPIYLAKEDVELLSNPNINSSHMTGESVKVNIDPIPVKDGDVITIKDYKIKVIATPFHTMGSVCYLMEDDNSLFTGDTLFKGSIGRTDCATSDPNLVMPSLKKLLSLNEWLVCYPGHGTFCRLNEEKKTNPFLIAAQK